LVLGPPGRGLARRWSIPLVKFGKDIEGEAVELDALGPPAFPVGPPAFPVGPLLAAAPASELGIWNPLVPWANPHGLPLGPVSQHSAIAATVKSRMDSPMTIFPEQTD
jgi:hypothetical protein